MRLGETPVGPQGRTLVGIVRLEGIHVTGTAIGFVAMSLPPRARLKSFQAASVGQQSSSGKHRRVGTFASLPD